MSGDYQRIRRILAGTAVFSIGLWTGLSADADRPARVYHNRLTRLTSPAPLLADYPEFVQPVIEKTRYEAPVLIDDPGADLDVRAWRFSYNARGIIELPNHLRADRTAAIMVHPWGIDDGQGWRTPEPAGVADFCTPDKNHLAGQAHAGSRQPAVKAAARPGFAGALQPAQPPVSGSGQDLSQHSPPTERSRTRRRTPRIGVDLERLSRTAASNVPQQLTISEEHPVRDYFQQFPGLDAGARFNHAGFWDLPIPVTKDVEVFPEDVVYYDDEGYPALRDFLKAQGVRHVLLTGYATDMCFCRTTAGYENLSKDFNVFLVGDATLATYPANETPRYATNAHISFASLNQLITQCSWIRFRSDAKGSTKRD